MKVPLAIVLATLIAPLIAQDTLITIYGQVTEAMTNDPLYPIDVVAIDPADSSYVVQAHTSSDGRFMLGLLEQRDVHVIFSADGHVPRRVQVVMEGPTERQWKKGYGLSVDMSLMRDLPGLDLSMGDRPIGRSVYDPATDVFIWDRSHSRSLADEQKRLLRSYKQHLPR